MSATDHFATVNSMIEALSSDDPEQRLGSMRGIHLIAATLGPDRTRQELLPFLTDSLDESDDVLREFAKGLATMLPDVGGVAYVKHLLDPLVMLCGLEDVSVRDEAVKSLSIIGSTIYGAGGNANVQKDFMKLLDGLVASESPLSRSSAAGLLCVPYPHVPVGTKTQLRQSFQTLCADEEIAVRRSAVVALGEKFAKVLDSHCADVVGSFETLCRDLSDGVRLQCVQSAAELAKYLPDSSKSVIVQAVKLLASDGSWRVRYMLADRLHIIGSSFSATDISRVVLPAFRTLCNDNEPEIRASVVFHTDAILALTSDAAAKKDILTQVQKLTTHEEAHVRMSLGSALMKCHAHVSKEMWSAVIGPACNKLLQDSEADVRLAVVGGFSSLGNSPEGKDVAPRLTEVIIALANDPKWRIRETVVQQLPALIANLGKSAEDVVSVCVNALDDRVAAIREIACDACYRLVLAMGVPWSKTTLFPKVMQMSLSQPAKSSPLNENTPVPHNYLRRVAFLHLVSSLMPAMEQAAFVDAFAVTLVSLAGDTVANVRINNARLLALAKKAGKSNKAMDGALNKLTSDTDVDVRDATITG